MKELRLNLFEGTENEDAHEHVQRVLEITDLFHIHGVTHDAILIRMFPITLGGASRRWKNMLPAGLDSLRYDMQKLKKSVHAIQVGCMISEGVHLTQECPFKEEGKNLEVNVEKLTQATLTNEDDTVNKVKEKNGKGLKKVCAVKKMPNYLKYVKDVFSSKKSINDVDAVKHNDKCLTILQNQLLLKENDPGSFTLPCLIDMVEDPKTPLILGRPILSTAHVATARGKTNEVVLDYGLMEKLGHECSG
ncbi:hypothetical protein Tco_0509403 [Tanacetum coccineum]